MVRIRRFSVIRTANTVALMYLIAILILAIPIALLLVASVTTAGPNGGQSTAVLAAPLIIVLAGVFYGLISWVTTALVCLLYNVTARFTGGIAVETFTDMVPASPAYPPATVPPPASADA